MPLGLVGRVAAVVMGRGTISITPSLFSHVRTLFATVLLPVSSTERLKGSNSSGPARCAIGYCYAGTWQALLAVVIRAVPKRGVLRAFLGTATLSRHQHMEELELAMNATKRSQFMSSRI